MSQILPLDRKKYFWHIFKFIKIVNVSFRLWALYLDPLYLSVANWQKSCNINLTNITYIIYSERIYIHKRTEYIFKNPNVLLYPNFNNYCKIYLHTWTNISQCESVGLAFLSDVLTNRYQLLCWKYSQSTVRLSVNHI